MKASELKAYLASGALDARLSALNFRDASVERARYSEILDRFIAAFGDKDCALFSAPGRSEVGGNHTDHNNGKVLACAVNLDIIAVAAKNDDGHIRVGSVGFDMIDIDGTDLSPKEEEKGDAAGIVRGVAAGVAALGRAVGGFDAITVSCVPAGSGLSSSAAFEVVLCKILDTLYNDGTMTAIEAAKLSQAAEGVFFGKPCGLMDQTACASGGFVKIDFADTKNPVCENIAFDLQKAGCSLFVVNTGGSHANLTGDYAAIRSEMGQVAHYFGKDVLRECDEQGFFANLPAIRSKCGDRAILRAIHYFAENKRVDGQAAALAEGDFDAFLRLINESGDSSFMYLQNAYSPSDPSAQGVSLGVCLGKRALEGAGAVRLHGGGFAGTIQAFVPADKKETFVQIMSAAFGAPAVMELQVRPDGPVCVFS